jgi:hypothetical protein
MDIKLPDGTILRGVPEGTTKEQIREKLAAKGYDVAKLDAPKPDEMYPAPAASEWEQVMPTPKPTAAGVVEGFTRGLTPYAIAAGAGAPFAGVGAIGGVTGLALTDAASGIWNSTAVPMFGAPRTMGGSELILAGTDVLGATKPVADDPNARIANQIASLGAGSIGMGNVINAGGQLLSKAPGAIGAIGNFFSKSMTPTSAVAGGSFGGGVQQGLIEAGVDPLVATGGGVLASMVGGQFGAGGGQPKYTNPAPTAKQLGAREKAAYEASKQQGIEFTPQAVDDIAQRAIRGAVAGATPDTGMSLGSVPSTVTRLLDNMTALAQKQGRLYLKDIETYRQLIGAEVSKLPNQGGLKTTGAAILRQFDELTAQPENTLNAIRGNVATARTAVQQADAAAKAAAGTPQQAAAETAANAARVNFDNAQKVMRTQDPDMIPLVQKSQQADEVVARATQIDKDATDAYNLANNAPNLAALEKAKDAAQAAHDAAVKRFSNRPDFKLQMSQYINRLQAATNAEDIAKASVAKTKTAADDAAARLRKAQAKAIVAEDAVTAKEGTLAAVDDAAARMAERNRLLAEGRAIVPGRKRTEAFEKMPAAAATAAGSSGLKAQALREEVRAFMDRRGGSEFRQLPEETRRQLERFVAGGGATQRTVDAFARLAPGANDRNLAGNIIFGLNSIAAGTAAAMSGGLSALAFPIAQGTSGFAGRAIGNAMAAKNFNQLRDMVARGDAVLPRQPGQAGNRAVNYMLNTATQPDIRQ